VNSSKYTVVYEKGDESYKICKIMFGSDGSYYITSPYHPDHQALLTKMTVNYAKQEMKVALEEAVEVASLDDDDRRLKMSHHPSGFVQFSGEGILSGRNADGTIKGIGVMSWPLDKPTMGPAFGISIRDIERFEKANKIRDQKCIFKHDEISPVPEPYSLALEGYYFPPLWRRFIQSQSDGTKAISINHPAGVVLKLKVLLAPEECARPGFIGLEMYTMPDEEYMKGGFILGGPTGNLRKNEQGETLGDGIYCMYPRGEIPARREINYRLPSVPQSH